MKNTFLSLLIIFLITSSCSVKSKGNPTRFKQGVFEIPASNNYGKTTIIRKDSLQIETYSKKVNISNDSSSMVKESKHIDTLFIKWKNNFSYTLRMKNPKTDLDKDHISVQITKVTDSSYNFTAKIGYSNFKQKGIVYKIK